MRAAIWGMFGASFLLLLGVVPPLVTLEIPDGSPFEPILLTPLPTSAIEVSKAGTLVYAGHVGPVMQWPRGESDPTHLFSPRVARGPEWGLTGLALAPDFDESGRFFLAYIADQVGASVDAAVLRVSSIEGGVESVLFETAAAASHNGGRLLVRDARLYVSTGDKEDAAAGLDVGRAEGKILRMMLSGLPPPDNPRASNPAWHPLAWSAGHADPFGLAWDDERDHVVVTDVDEAGDEVVAIATPGGDRELLLKFGEDLHPVGLDVVGNAYYVATFRTNELVRLRMNSNIWLMETIHRHPTHLLDVEVTHDGAWAYFGAWDGLWTLALREEAWGQADTMPAPIAPPPLESVIGARTVPAFGAPWLVVAATAAFLGARRTRGHSAGRRADDCAESRGEEL